MEPQNTPKLCNKNTLLVGNCGRFLSIIGFCSFSPPIVWRNQPHEQACLWACGPRCLADVGFFTSFPRWDNWKPCEAAWMMFRFDSWDVPFGQQMAHWRFQHFIYLLSCIPNIYWDWMIKKLTVSVIFLEWVEAPSGRCAVWSPFHCPSWKASTEHIKTRIWGFAIYFSMTWTCICLVVCRLGRKKVTHIELEVHVYTCMWLISCDKLVPTKNNA